MLNNILYIGFFFGILGTFIGGWIGVFLKFKKQKTLSCILEFAAGLMLAVVTFDLLPESFEFGGNFITIIFFIIGVIGAILLENVVNKQIYVGVDAHHIDPQNKFFYRAGRCGHRPLQNLNLIKTGILVGIGLALHNFPEGLAIGSRFFRIPWIRFFASISHSFSWYSWRNLYGSSNEKWWHEHF